MSDVGRDQRSFEVKVAFFRHFDAGHEDAIFFRTESERPETEAAEGGALSAGGRRSVDAEQEEVVSERAHHVVHVRLVP